MRRRGALRSPTASRIRSGWSTGPARWRRSRRRSSPRQVPHAAAAAARSRGRAALRHACSEPAELIQKACPCWVGTCARRPRARLALEQRRARPCCASGLRERSPARALPMIAFGCSITRPERYRRCAEPGIRRAAEARLGALRAAVDRLDRRELQRDCSTGPPSATTSRRSCSCTRTPRSSSRAVREGPRGAARPRGGAGRLRRGARRAQHRLVGGIGDARLVHQPLRGARRRRPAIVLVATGSDAPAWAQTGEVETLDGFVLVFSPWAVRNIRFDESLGRFHGYDLDYCLQVREAGRKVVTADFRAIHHRADRDAPDPEEWIEAHISVAEKWDGRMPRGRHGAGDLARARAAGGGRARRRARAGAHEGASSSRPAPASSERGMAETRDEPVVAADRAAAAGSAPRAMIAFGVRRRRRRRPTAASPRPASGSPPSPTRRSTCSRRSARSAAATTCSSTRRRGARATSRRS